MPKEYFLLLLLSIFCVHIFVILSVIKWIISFWLDMPLRRTCITIVLLSDTVISLVLLMDSFTIDRHINLWSSTCTALIFFHPLLGRLRRIRFDNDILLWAIDRFNLFFKISWLSCNLWRCITWWLHFDCLWLRRCLLSSLLLHMSSKFKERLRILMVLFFSDE
jgi:hypothetical protein